MNKWIVFLTLLLLVMASIQLGQGNTAVSAQISSTNTYLPLIYNNHDPAAASIFGLQLYSSTRPTDLYYDSLIGTKATWVRNRVSWSSIEPTNVIPAFYNWASADATYTAARGDMGKLNFIGTIEFAPEWAAPQSNGPIYPQSLDDFAEFVGALVERYDGDGQDDAPGAPVITYWEFYNEPDNNSDPNNPDFTEPMHWGDHGAEYANMLATVYPVIKAANPKAQVVFGGIALDWFERENGPFVETFLQDVLAAGGGNYFDVMNFHSYPAFHARWTTNLGPGLLGKAAYVRNVLAQYGLTKPLIITEAGWMSNFQPGAPIPGTPETQARYVVELFTESMAADIDVMIWWLLVDPSFPYPFMNGLVTQAPNITPKLSYYVYQDAVAELSKAHFVRALTAAETGHPLMEAYFFTDMVHERDLYVVWLNPVHTTETALFQFEAAGAMVRDSLTGGHLYLEDGADGTVDGKVTIFVGATPLYLEIEQ